MSSFGTCVGRGEGSAVLHEQDERQKWEKAMVGHMDGVEEQVDTMEDEMRNMRDTLETVVKQVTLLNSRVGTLEHITPHCETESDVRSLDPEPECERDV